MKLKLPKRTTINKITKRSLKLTRVTILGPLNFGEINKNAVPEVGGFLD